MPSYTAITIIFNPKASGSGKALAAKLAADLRRELPKVPVKVIPTQHKGHAEELAYHHAKASRRPLIVSASGDGGYHEVVNGVMRAKAEGATPATVLLPAGNANDHYKHVHEGDVVQAIVADKTRRIDVMKLTTTVKGKPFERYAHSYIGFGLTPKVGHKLNKNKEQLNPLKELLITLRELAILRPVRLVVDGHERPYDSLVLSNIRSMAKGFTMSKSASHDDGKFEVTAFPHRFRLRLLVLIFRAMTFGLDDSPRVKRYDFRTVGPTMMQLDGEITTVDADSAVSVRLQHHALECIV